LPNFWKGFEPLAPGFLHAPSPDPYRFTGTGSAGAFYADALERVVLQAGAHTVAAVVAEPVQGAGGVIVPPPDYFPRLREVCDRHGLLLIADEVITGFGRTGRWFALEHWNVQADLMIFAKGVTSGYLPLSGVMLTRSVHDTLKSVKGPFMHGFTYSGHPTACAVALRNLRILDEERLVERAAARDPFKLPDSWLRANENRQVNLATPFNLCTTNDIIGGNPGSPVFDKDRQIVGLIFDGNIQSLGGKYGFDESVNRAVSVHSSALLEALDHIYGARRIVTELKGGAGTTTGAGAK